MPKREVIDTGRAPHTGLPYAHRRAGRDMFVTSDLNLIKAARRLGIDAVTPENLLVRVGGET